MEKHSYSMTFSIVVLIVPVTHWVAQTQSSQAIVHLISSALKIKSLIYYSRWTHPNLLDLTVYLLPCMLQSTVYTCIAPSLTKLFNLSITSGCFPTGWKCTRITPIFKSADPALPSNYRPCNIDSSYREQGTGTPYYNLVFNHLAISSPISVSQWGFMPNR